MKRRNDELIISQVLDICKMGALKTGVQYKANLNYVTANRYLDILIKNGMIAKSTRGSKTIFKTTSKGFELKDRINRLYLEIDEIQIVALDALA